MSDLSVLLAELERLRTALQAIRDTPRKDGILACQRIAAEALRGISASTVHAGESSLGDPAYFAEVISYLHWRWRGRCAYCKAFGAEQIDHVKPVSRGGSDEVSNLVLACQPCNKRKGTQTATEFGHGQVFFQAIGQTLEHWRRSAERERRDAEMVRGVIPPDSEEPF